MADIITRLKVDTKNHDEGLKKAGASVKKYSQESSAIDGVLSKLIGTFGKYATAIGVTTTAMKVLSDMVKRNETLFDEYNRCIKASDSVYTGFLESLNNGDISGYLTRINQIVSAAREAYTAIDELGTQTAFNKRSNAKARSAYTNALADYKENPTEANRKRTEIAFKAYQDSVSENISANERAYQAAINDIATTRLASSVQQLQMKNLLSNGRYTDIKNILKGYSTGTGLNAGAQYWNGNQVQGDEMIIRNKGGNTIRRKMTPEELSHFRFAQAFAQLNDTKLDEVQSLGAQTYLLQDELNQQRRSYNRLMGNNGKSGNSTNSVRNSSAKSSSATESLIPYYDLEPYFNQTMGITGEGFQIPTLQLDIESNAEDLLMNTLGYLDEYDKKVAKTRQDWQTVAGSIANVGSGLQSMDNEALNVTGILAQAVANIMLAFSKSSIEAAGGGWVGWIAATTAGLATALSTVSAMKSAGAFAEGGVIGGNSYYGDRLIAHVNSGETILTSDMTANAVRMIEGGQGGGRSTISGEQIVSVVNAYGRRTGRGEILK